MISSCDSTYVPASPVSAVSSIGPITSKTVRDHGLKVDVEARRHDIDGLVKAILELLTG